MKRWPLLALVTVALAACGQQTTGPTAPSYDDVAGAWSLTPSLGAQSLGADVNTLNYEKALVATSAWGAIEVNRSNGEQGSGDGKALTLNGMVYPKGHGVHAPSELKYSLAGSDSAQCVRFKAQVGVDDEVGAKGSVIFQVWGDNTKLFDSGVMTGSSGTQHISVDLRGKSTIRLVATDAGNGKSYDHADWINPTITCVPDISINVPNQTSGYQDQHGSVSFTLLNRSRQFRGNLTFTTSGGHLAADPRTVRVTGAGAFPQALNAYVQPFAEPETELPDEVVVSYQGEVITSAPLRVFAKETVCILDLPDQVVELPSGGTTTIQAHLQPSPVGERVGCSLYVFGQENGSGPVWYTVSGGADVPREGGTLTITVRAGRVPGQGEVTAFLAHYSTVESIFNHGDPGSQEGDLRVRFVP